MTVFIKTDEGSGIDRYSQELARRIGVPIVTSGRYLSLDEGLGLLRSLQSLPGAVHFPSQHFARFGFLLERPYIVTVHDLARICFPFATESPVESFGLRMDALGVKRAEHLIAVSECTKADLMRYLDVPEDKISVVYNGIDHQIFRPVPNGRFNFPYLLYVGTERPRKNLGSLLQALAALKKESAAFRNLKLIKVGSAGRAEDYRRTTLREVERLGLDDDVIFTEQVLDQDLASYYSSAAALIVPSLYEGFGLPLVEAMACGCPIVASSKAALPEVAGGAALFFNPNDSGELSHCIRRILTEPGLRADLREKGFQRVQSFSWERAAEETITVYRQVESRLDTWPGVNGRCTAGCGNASCG